MLDTLFWGEDSGLESHVALHRCRSASFPLLLDTFASNSCDDCYELVGLLLVSEVASEVLGT